MRLTIVGGGGFRVPLVYSAVAQARHRVPITEVVLTDTDPTRLEAIESVLTGMGFDLPLSTTTSLDDALGGAACVFAAIRVGGTQGRINDERVALSHGLLGQETIGPGGLAYAIRTLAVMEDLAQRVARLCPQAWIINFTNPAGLITQAMLDHHPRVVGICDTPIGLVRRVARVLGQDVEAADIGYLGINHLGWLKSFTVDGVDHLQGLLADPQRLAQIEEARTLGVPWVQTMGAIPNEYVYYYHYTREVVATLSGAGATRGEFLDTQQTRFYTTPHDHPHQTLGAWRQTLREREETYMAEARDQARQEEDISGGYHEVAVDLMAGVLAGEHNRMILGVANRGAIPQLPQQATVEVVCQVDEHGVHPIHPTPQLDLDHIGLIIQVKAAEQELIAAVRAGSQKSAWRAFASHPLVDSVAVARDLVQDYIHTDPLIARALPNE
ncbi:MAG TPA: 6-phospho-beta-glucosidase [Beutenbergiaceae bacterium]|nr:6-phospho-beta-glucosidase [Beutenbergiaceae bacterium]